MSVAHQIRDWATSEGAWSAPAGDVGADHVINEVGQTSHSFGSTASVTAASQSFNAR